MATTDDLIGKKVGDFVVQERIGQGGMAVVYRAFQPGVNRDVALKIIRVDKDDETDDFRRRFSHEAEMIAALEHIHILPIYAYGIEDDRAYLAMRLLRGGSLSQLLRKGPLPINRAADLLIQVASGLAYAHSRGVIHRDLKPSNIMMDDAGNAYLTDFGLAKMIEGGSDITKTGNIVGTPQYMSPEQLRGELLDRRSDIYSLGIVLYQMVTGKQPFEAITSDLVSVIYKHLEQPPKPPSDINPEVPPQLEEVILTALQKDPQDRYQTIQEMVNALNVALGRSSTQVEVPTTGRGTTTRRFGKPRELSPAYALIGAVVIMIVVGVALALVLIAIDQNTQTQIAAQTAVALNMTATANAATPTPIPMPTVLAGVEGSVDENLPTDAEIAAAQARLGQGFIAYIACTLDTAYHAGQAREVTSMLAGYGLRTELYNPDTVAYTQVTLLEQAIADGASGVIICPLDSDLLADSLTAVDEADIPLVQLSQTPPGYGGVLLAGDDYAMGYRAGSYAGQLITEELGGEANVLILHFPEMAQIVVRANAMIDGLEQYAPNAQIVGSVVGGTPELGYESVRAAIAEGLEFDVIVSINDAGSFGAIRAMEEAGFAPSSVIVVSVDAEPQAQQYIQQGYFMRGSVAVNRSEISRAAVFAMTRLLAGSTIPETLLVEPGNVVTLQTLAEATLDAAIDATVEATAAADETAEATP